MLFNLLAHRYERGSVMITSNLPFSQWEQIFKDPMTTVAAIDRLVPPQRRPRTQHQKLPSRGIQETTGGLRSRPTWKIC